MPYPPYRNIFDMVLVGMFFVWVFCQLGGAPGVAGMWLGSFCVVQALCHVALGAAAPLVRLTLRPRAGFCSGSATCLHSLLYAGCMPA